jgi:protein-disulfide isomerase
MAKDRMEPGGGGRRDRSVKAARKQSKGPFYAIVAVVALAGLATLLFLVNRQGGAAVATLDPNLPPVAAEGYTMGSPSAPVEIIEFADFECPGCGQWAMVTEPDVRSRLIQTGQAKFRFLDFPVNSSHANSLTASLAAGCAHDQGKFWEMHDLIFQTQGQWSTPYSNNPRKVMNQLAEQLSLNMQQFAECMDSKRHQAKVKANAEEAARVGANSTPSFLIGGKIYQGASYDEIKAAVDEARAKAGVGTGATTTAAPADTARR